MLLLKSVGCGTLSNSFSKLVTAGNRFKPLNQENLQLTDQNSSWKFVAVNVRSLFEKGMDDNGI